MGADIGGVDRVVVSRFQGGVFQPPEQIDATLPGPSSQPVVGAADNGRLAIAFVSGGVVYGVVRPAGQPLRRADPARPGLRSLGRPVDQRHGVRVVHSPTGTCGSPAWTAARTPGRGSRRPSTSIPRAPAGVDNGRSRVAISADGIGVVTWGEAGTSSPARCSTTGSPTPRRTSPRRRSATASRPSPTCPTSTPRTTRATPGSSFASSSPTAARARSRAASAARSFDPPVAVDTGDEPVRDPRIDINGRGRGLATSAGAATGQPLHGADRQPRRVRCRQPDPRAQHGDVGRGAGDLREQHRARRRGARRRRAPVVRRARARTPTAGRGPDVGLSRPEFGPVDPLRRLRRRLRSRRRDRRRLGAGRAGRAPDRRPASSTALRRGSSATPASAAVAACGRRCKWQPAFNLWGALRYDVLVDGVLVGQAAGARRSRSPPR